ncbi:regulator of sirC expression with transglutaminase-like and TPR domain [Pontibacter mucosus]|uniref:Regulator of sirC expression with transglutaminase-like and TPR domain n=1 Tax=Pontibacter mucosus TaxID=1649266 RepID=A0A2T5YJP5_9BACT|nr:transglutaminase-like domain-containing protein [Pontibacter mucosus]PTX19534.1 regulator of sirC expression with transglutaminase-like and TPR domain [Pontibacter mucosus]
MTKGEIKALISLLDDSDFEVVSHVEKQIAYLGEGIIPFLEEEWEETLNSSLQKKIEDLIHNLQFDALQKRLLEWKDAGAENLLEGMFLVNSYLYPDVDFAGIAKTMDQLYFDAWTQMKDEMHPYDQVKSLNNVLFREKRFSANTKNFHSPANSMLHLVLESKRGNPLTLCVIYMTLAQRLNMPVYGVNLPNLFILTYKMNGLQFYINVYNKGLILSKADIDNYILQLNLNPVDIFYEPCSNLDIIKRALRNLAFSFEKMDDPEKATEVTKLLEIISDEEQPNQRETL